jgi:hypothetical protein
MHDGVMPNAYVRGSIQIDFALATLVFSEHVADVGLLKILVLQSDQSCLFVDLRIEGIFGQNPDKLAPHQFRNLKLDDPQISDTYDKVLHKQFECHNFYRRVNTISVKGKYAACNLEDEAMYNKLDDYISESMKDSE